MIEASMICPDIARCPRAFRCASIGDGEAADEAVRPINGDVVLVAEDRDGDLDPRPRGAVLALRSGLRALQRPPRLAILLRELLRLGCPALGNAAFLDGCLLGLAVALTRRSNDRGIDDL